MRLMFKWLSIVAVLMLGASPANASCWQWSKTASNNATADPSINWSEGQAPSSINDSARAMMARLAECRDDLSGFNITTGGAIAYALASNQGTIAAVPNNGQSINARLNVTNGVASTLIVDGGTAYPIQTAPGTAVASGVLVAGTPYTFTFNSSSLAWVLNNFYATTVGPGSIVTSMLADNSVTYAKMQKPSTTSRLLGTPSLASKVITGAANNGSGLIRLTMSDTTGLTTGQSKTVQGVVGTTEANGTWTITVISSTTVDLQGSTFANVYVSGGVIGGAVEEISLGNGVAINNNVLSAAFPPAGSFKNLVIKVTANTTAAVSADSITTTNGSNFQTTALSCSLNMATTGAGGIDTGSIASATWYAVWAIVKADGTTTCEASLQGAANGTFIGNLPSGYTYYARVGWLRTASGSAQLLGTWQFGRKAQYIIGLAQTTVIPVLVGGTTVGTYNNTSPTLVATSVANFAPSTASIIKMLTNVPVSTAQYIVAPSAAYSGTNNGPIGSNNIRPPMWNNGGQLLTQTEIFLESTNLYIASDTSSNMIAVAGWEDNI